MKIDLVIVCLAVVTRYKTFILVWVACHYTGSNSLLNLVIEFCNRTDADSLAILTCPDWQRSTPVTATAQVPIVKVFKPLAKTSCTCRLRFPCNGLVELAHALLHLRCTHKPAVERIVKHGLVGTPTVWIVVYVLLNLECQTGLLENHTERNVKSLGFCRSLLVVTAVNSILWIVCILHISRSEFCILFNIYKICNEIIVKFIDCPELTGEVNHRTSLTLLVNHEKRRDARSLCHESIVGTECRSNMNDTCTVLSSNIVTGDNAESLGRCINDILTLFLHRFHPWEQLCIVHTYEVTTLVLGNHLVRNNLVTRLVLFERHFSTGRVEVRCQKRLCKHQCHRLSIVCIVCLHRNVVNLWTYAKRSV